jgi:hypothetical protein
MHRMALYTLAFDVCGIILNIFFLYLLSVLICNFSPSESHVPTSFTVTAIRCTTLSVYHEVIVDITKNGQAGCFKFLSVNNK